MGEIKSTLDMVLEKTRHLSLSAEEKQAQAQKDSLNRLRGILQKYVDGLSSLEQLQRDYRGLQAEFKLPDHTALAGQVIERLDPDRDNRALFAVLDRCCSLDSGGLADAIDQYQAGYQTAARNHGQALKESLARKYNISGSAVVPNLQADEKWRQKARELASALEVRINQERVKLVGS